MSCPGSFLFGQKHTGGHDAAATASADALPSMSGLNGLLLPDSRGSSPSLLCASCSRIPGALVSKELLIAVDLAKLPASAVDLEELLGRMESSEAAWKERLGRRVGAYSSKDEITLKASESAKERLEKARNAAMAGSWSPELFGHLARKLADDQEQDLWILAADKDASFGGKSVVILLFLNSVRLHNWRRNFKLWAGEASSAIVGLEEDYLPLYPSQTDGISLSKTTTTSSTSGPKPQAPLLDPSVLTDSALRLSILLHSILGLTPSSNVTRELGALLATWLRSWYAAVVSKQLVPITKAGTMVQGGALVGTSAGEEEEADDFFPQAMGEENEGPAVGTVLNAIAMVLKGLSFRI